MLLKNAAARGARVYEGARVTAVEMGRAAGADTLVTLALENGGEQVWRTRFLVDASGRDTFLSNRLDIKRKNRQHASAAIFGHFRNARRNSGAAEGNIPSCGSSTAGSGSFRSRTHHQRRRGVPAYVSEIAHHASQRFSHADHRACSRNRRPPGQRGTNGAATATGNYSYLSEHMAGEGYLMVGDAWAFVDPVFSSGVYLAMNSATLGADVVDAVLKDPAQAPRLNGNSSARCGAG